MRKYYLVNDIGVIYDLQQSSIVFLGGLSGLGFAQSVTYQNQKDGFFSITKTTPMQKPLNGTVHFLTDFYNKAREFIDFIINSDGLTLIYQPLETEYRIDVDCNVFDHNGITGGTLPISLSMTAKTPWYKAVPILIEFEPIPTENAKIYTYVYPYNYRASSDDNSVVVSPSGHFPAELTFESPGPLLNFAIQAKTSDGELIGRMEIEGCDILLGQTLHYSTRAKDSGVWRILADGTKEELINYINLANTNFFEITPNENTTISISSTGTQPDTATLKIYEYYKAV